MIHVDSFLNVLDLTPPAVPGSSPWLIENSEPLIAIMLPPSAFTVVVPLARLLERETFGYGSGTGPPGDGVLHTSGMVAIEKWLLPLCTREFITPLTLIVRDI